MSSNIINATAEAKLNGAVRNRAVASAGFLRKGHTHNARDSWPTSTRFGSILIFIAALCSPRTKLESTLLCPRSLMFLDNLGSYTLFFNAKNVLRVFFSLSKHNCTNMYWHVPRSTWSRFVTWLSSGIGYLGFWTSISNPTPNPGNPRDFRGPGFTGIQCSKNNAL